MTHTETPEYPAFDKHWDFSDLVIKSNDNRYYVHKAVISMWSPQLKRQILEQKDTEEDLDIGDFRSDTIIIMLQTIYPPNRPIDIQNCQDLVKIGNELTMFELLRRCEQFLIDKKNPSLELLIFAQEQSLSKLLSRCVEYCAKLPLDEMKRNSHYNQIGSQNLSNLLELRCGRTEKKLKRSEMRCWELTCTLRAIYESWTKKEGACLQHRPLGMHQENCNDCLHAIRRQIDKLCELALDNPSDQSD